MEFKEHQIQSFIIAYHKAYGISLSKSEACKKASSVIRFLALSVIPFESSMGHDTIRKPD